VPDGGRPARGARIVRTGGALGARRRVGAAAAALHKNCATRRESDQARTGLPVGTVDGRARAGRARSKGSRARSIVPSARGVWPAAPRAWMLCADLVRSHDHAAARSSHVRETEPQLRNTGDLRVPGRRSVTGASTASPEGRASASRRRPGPSTTRGARRPDGCRCRRGALGRPGSRSVEARPARADARSTIQFRVCGIQAWRKHNGRACPTFRHCSHRYRGSVTNCGKCRRPQESATAAL